VKSATLLISPMAFNIKKLGYSCQRQKMDKAHGWTE